MSRADLRGRRTDRWALAGIATTGGEVSRVSVEHVRAVVDAALDRAIAENPGVEYAIALPLPSALLLPTEQGRIWSSNERHQLGYIEARLYRGCDVHGVGGMLVEEVHVAPVIPSGGWRDRAAPGYYVANLETGQVERR